MRHSMKAITMILAMLAMAPLAQAEGFFDWLEQTSQGKKGQSAAVEQPADGATLLTLEPHESESYPRLSADGKQLLVNASNGKKSWVSKRSLANGDPLNVVADDHRAADSVSWSGDKVVFLSQRGNSLGLWEKVADGQGLIKRLHELNGNITQPLILADGAMIAVRLRQTGKSKQTRQSDGFTNWEVTGYQAMIVRIERSGSEKVLSEGINPALSPDGQWIAFSMADGRDMHLYIMRSDGSELSQLTADVRSVDVQPSWSADGKRLVFTSNRAEVDMRHPNKGNWDVWIIDREGRNLTRITMDEARDGAAVIGANGRIYFHSDRKVDNALKKERQIKGGVGNFHIWSIAMPE